FYGGRFTTPLDGGNFRSICALLPTLLYSRTTRSSAGQMHEVSRLAARGAPKRSSPSAIALLNDRSELRPRPIGNLAGDLCRRLVGDREYRTDVDLAKHVAVGPVGAGWAEHEVRVPDQRQVAPLDVRQGDQLRRPLVLHQPAQALEARLGIGRVEPRSSRGEL